MPVTKLSFSNVGPFDEIEFEFDPQVNVFTGPNNSGKSSALWVLGELLVYPFTMPARSLRSDTCKWSLSLSPSAGASPFTGTLPIQPEQLVHLYEVIGHTCYIPAQRYGTEFRSSGPTVKRDLEAFVNEQVELYAHERPTALRQLGEEAVRQVIRQSVVDEDQPELARRQALMMAGSSLVTDEAVKQKIVDLDYAAYRKNRPEIRAIIDKVVSMAAEVTEGYPVQFQEVAEDPQGLYPLLTTPDGNLPLHVLSQGTQSIIHFMARLIFGYAEYYDFPSDLEDKRGILIIDEIDAHLHPSWQRRIIPTLTDNFPNLQIFCSTHSPLMLAGLKEGQVQLLQRDEENRVTVSRNEDDIVGWSADEILRGHLGLRDPTDQGTVDKLERLRQLRRKRILSSEESVELETLRESVSEDLMSGPAAAQVDRFIQALEQAKAGGDL